MRRLAACLVALLSFPGCATPRSALPPATALPFAWAHGLIFVEVTLPGRESVLALLDTGASASAIDPRYAADLPVLDASDVVGTTGRVAAETVSLDSLCLGSLRLPSLHATRRPLSGLAPEGRTLDMILGSDAFSGMALTIDFEKNRLLIAPRSADGAEGGVPMILDNGIPAIEANLGGLDVWLRIDTGASLFETSDVYINIPKHVWDALRDRNAGLEPSTHFQGTGAGGTTVDLPVAPIQDARIGPAALDRAFVIVQPEVGYFADPAAKGFVSNNFLRRIGRVTLDYAAGRFRADRARYRRIGAG